MSSEMHLDVIDAIYWSGLDVAKATFDAAFVTCGQHYAASRLREVPVEQFERTPEGVEAFLAWLDRHLPADETRGAIRVCMESTGIYSTELAVWILEQRPSLRPAIVNPRHTSAFIKSLGLRNKTDRLEARALAFYGAERNPEAYASLSPERAQLRELSRYRDDLVHQRVAESNRNRQAACAPVVERMRQKRLRLLEADIARVEVAMKKLVAQHPDLKRDIGYLESIYGVGFITAVIVLSELGDLRRFERARQLTAYAGLSPRIVQSGATVNKKPRMCKQGNSRVRQALYLAAMTAVRGRSDLSRTYHELIKQGKPPMRALGAVMRKLLTIMRAILIAEKSYHPNHKTCGKLAPNTAK